MVFKGKRNVRQFGSSSSCPFGWKIIMILVVMTSNLFSTGDSFSITTTTMMVASSSSSSRASLKPKQQQQQQQTFNNNNKNDNNNIFASVNAQLQRNILKKKLILAAKGKNEALVVSLVDELSRFNPTICPTRGLASDRMNNNANNTNTEKSSKRTVVGDSASAAAAVAPLNGRWKLLYTNARDAEAPARTQKTDTTDTTFGERRRVADGVQITTGQYINAAKGECINSITATGDSPPFDRLEITIRMTPLTDTRVRLDFLRGRAWNSNAPLPFLKDFSFSFPPVFVGDVLARLRGKDPAVEPPAYFDVLYLDDTLRAHRTGEGKIFVQERVSSS